MLSDSAMSKRKAIPRLIRTAAAGAIGLAAAGGLAAFAGPARPPTSRAPRARHLRPSSSKLTTRPATRS